MLPRGGLIVGPEPTGVNNKGTCPAMQVYLSHFPQQPVMILHGDSQRRTSVVSRNFVVYVWNRKYFPISGFGSLT